MRAGSFSLALLLSCVLVVSVVCRPMVSLDVHRLLQFQRDGTAVADQGTQSAVLRGRLVLVDPTTYEAGAATACVALVQFGSSTQTDGDDHGQRVQAAIDQLLNDQPSGVVFTEAVLDAPGIAGRLVSKPYPFPMVLAAPGPNLTRLIEDVVPAIVDTHVQGIVYASMGDHKKDTPSKLELTDVQVVQATFRGDTTTQLQNRGSKKSAAAVATGKSMLLSAGWDAVGIAPSRAFVDVSGAAAAAEIHKSLSQYPSPTTSSLQTILSNYARWNFVGTRRWVASQTQALSDLVDFTVSLDTLLPNPATPDTPVVLYVHTTTSISLDMSAGTGGDALATFVRMLAATVAAEGVSLQVVQKKINVTHHDLRFEHEVFAHKKVPAVTLSTLEAPVGDQILRHASSSPRVFDDATAAKYFAIAKSIQKAIAQYLNFEPDAVSVVSEAALQALVNVALNNPTSLLATDASGTNNVRRALEKHLRRTHTTGAAQVAVKKYPNEGLPLHVFGPLDLTLHMYAAKTTLAEVAITVAIGVYVVAFAVVTFGVEKSMLLLAGAKQID